MFAKVQITGVIELITGMHIGASGAFSAIGAVDAPIIKDVRTGNPMIPGSSLKGKMRSLLAKRYNTTVATIPDEDAECLLSLFGSAKKPVRTGRILFSDMLMCNWESLKEQGLTSKTEIKFENAINRTTAVANPRQIERAVRGSEFELNLIYEMNDEAQMEEDFKILKEGFRLLEYDYLGGSGSRGYGKVKFKELEVVTVIGEVSDEVLEKCQNILND